MRLLRHDRTLLASLTLVYVALLFDGSRFRTRGHSSADTAGRTVAIAAT
jgi:hypothetical protein